MERLKNTFPLLFCHIQFVNDIFYGFTTEIHVLAVGK